MHNHKLLSHVLAVEFPELATRISELKANDPHFAHMLDNHDSLDRDIAAAEKGTTTLDDLALERLKKERLHLKDTLYRLAAGTA